MDKDQWRDFLKKAFPHGRGAPQNLVEEVSPFLEGDVLSFFPLSDELDIGALNLWLLEEGRLYFPKIEGDQLVVKRVVEIEPKKKGSYGTHEPIKTICSDKNQISTILVPALGLDFSFHRIGRGKGYYDRFLKGLDLKVSRISIIYKEQLVPSLPKEIWDQKVDKIFVY